MGWEIMENRPPLPEKKVEQVPWTLRQTFLGILLTLVPWIALALGVASLNRHAGRTTALPPQVDLANAVIVFILSSLVEGAFLIAPVSIAVRAFRGLRQKFRLAWRALGLRRFSVGNAISWVIILFLGILVVNQVYASFITTFHLPVQTNDQVLLENAKYAPLTTYATLLASVIVAPFCEEVFFRGFVFMGLWRGMAPGWAMVLSALIFAVAHADPGSFVVLFLIGVALAFLRWHTHSLWPGMLLHFLNNSVGALLIVLAMRGILHT
jgi:membrane protease YdiL (CAAX protease family)